MSLNGIAIVPWYLQVKTWMPFMFLAWRNKFIIKCNRLRSLKKMAQFVIFLLRFLSFQTHDYFLRFLAWKLTSELGNYKREEEPKHYATPSKLRHKTNIEGDSSIKFRFLRPLSLSVPTLSLSSICREHLSGRVTLFWNKSRDHGSNSPRFKRHASEYKGNQVKP